MDAQYDYTNGQLGELVDIIISSKARLFVSAIGVPPKEVVERLHKAGIVVMKYVWGPPLHNHFEVANFLLIAWWGTQRYAYS